MELKDIQPLVGEQFAVPSDIDGEPFVLLNLCSAESSGKGHSGRAEPFSLIFEGPSSSPLSQGSYRLSNANLSDQDIFVVPISDDGTNRQYQAIFN